MLYDYADPYRQAVELKRMLAEHCARRHCTVFYIVWAPARQNIPPQWRLVMERDSQRLRYMKTEPWRVLGCYRAKETFDKKTKRTLKAATVSELEDDVKFWESENWSKAIETKRVTKC